MSDNNPSAADPLGQIADEFVEAFRQGQRPGVEEFVRRYPAHADEIRDMLPALLLMEKAKSADDDAGQRRQATASAPAAPLQQLGDYQLLREVGRGGMGVVYEAQQLSLGRHVAIKVLPSQALLDPRQLGRFQREARSAAKLHHTNIVPVFGVGEQDGQHYYVMQFIQGLGLDVVLDELRRLRRRRGKPATPLGDAPGRPPDVTRDLSAVDVARSLLTGQFRAPEPSGALTTASGEASLVASAPGGPVAAAPARPADASATIHLPGQSGGPTPSDSGLQYWQSVARVGMQVADALAHAASQGVLHRDIKPSNLLLDDTGNVWVTDFGLAKAASDSDDLTHTGDVVGTLRYMAPERFNGQGDLRSDVYSLGLTLYELLAQRPAFDEADRNKLVKQVMHDEPVRPRKLNRAVPRDLETVVLKAIARDPAHRYQTPAAMAEDLKRFVEDRPVRARRASEAERLYRWCRRNPSIAVLGGVLTAVLVLVTVASLLAAGHFNRLRLNEARAAQDEREARAAGAEQKQRAEEALLDAIDQTYLATRNEVRAMRLARQSGWRSAALDRRQGLVRLGSRNLDRADLRTEALACLAGLDVRPQSSLITHDLGAWHVRYSPDGRKLAVNDDKKNVVRLLDLTTNQELRTIPKALGFSPFAFHPSGTLAVPSAAGRVAFFPINLGGPAFPEITGDGYAVNLAFSRSGDRLAVVWGAVDPANKGYTVKPRRVCVYETATGKTAWAVDLPANTPGGYKFALALSPDGQSLATVGPDCEVRLYAVGKADAPAVLGRLDVRICAIEFHPDGQSLVAGGRLTGAVWDLRSRSERFRIHAPEGGLWDVAYSPDGQLIAGACNDQTLRLWDSLSGREQAVVPCETGHASLAVAFSPTEDRLAVGGAGVAVFGIEGRRDCRHEMSAINYLTGLAFDKDRPALYSCGGDGRVRTWDLNEPTAGVLRLTGRREDPMVIRLHPEGRHLAFGFGPFLDSKGRLDFAVSVWRLDGDAAERRLEGPQKGVSDLAFDLSGKRLAAASEDGGLYVWDFETGALRHRLALQGVRAVHFLDETRLLAAAGNRLILLKADDGAILREVTLPTAAAAFVLNPDGREALVGTADGTIHRVRLPDLALEQSRKVLDRPSNLVMAIAPGGELLYVTTLAGPQNLLLDPRTLEPIARLPETDRRVNCLAFDHHGRWFALGGAQITLWDLALVRAELARIDLGFGDRNGPARD